MHLRSDQKHLSLAGTMDYQVEDHMSQHRTLYRYYPQNTSRRADYDVAVRLGRILRERHATDPKDKAFALYGILERVNIPQPLPDYHKSLGTIYHKLYKQILRHQPRMVNLLVDAGGGRLDGPSWVPDWSTIHHRAFLPASYITDPIKDFTNDQRPLLSVRDHILDVQGIWRGNIAYVSPSLSTLMRNYETDNDDTTFSKYCAQMHALLEWFRYILQYTSSGHPLETISTSAYSTLMAHVIPFGSNQPEFSGDCYETYQLWFSETLHTFFGANCPSGDVETVTAIRRFVEHHSYARKFLQQCSENLYKRRSLFFSRECGIGTGPRIAIAGDHIVNIVWCVRSSNSTEGWRRLWDVSCSGSGIC